MLDCKTRSNCCYLVITFISVFPSRQPHKYDPMSRVRLVSQMLDQGQAPVPGTIDQPLRGLYTPQVPDPIKLSVQSVRISPRVKFPKMV